MPRGDPVHGVVIVRYLQAISGQLVSKAYRPGTAGRGRLRQPRQPLGELLGPADQWLPDPLSISRVERREDLAAEAVEHGQPLPARPRLGDPAGESVEGRDAGRRQAGGGGQSVGGGDADPQAGERAGAEPDRDQIDRLPAAGRSRRALDLAQ